MLDGTLFESLAAIARDQRRDMLGGNRPWGGLQLCITGDFLQLPPVVKGNEEPVFAFEAESWGTAIRHQVLLTEVFRQRDQDFVDALNELRVGRPSQRTIALFTSLSREPAYTDGIKPTELCVAAHNTVLTLQLSDAQAGRCGESVPSRGPARSFRFLQGTRLGGQGLCRHHARGQSGGRGGALAAASRLTF